MVLRSDQLLQNAMAFDSLLHLQVWVQKQQGQLCGDGVAQSGRLLICSCKDCSGGELEFPMVGNFAKQQVSPDRGFCWCGLVQVFCWACLHSLVQTWSGICGTLGKSLRGFWSNFYGAPRRKVQQQRMIGLQAEVLRLNETFLQG